MAGEGNKGEERKGAEKDRGETGRGRGRGREESSGGSTMGH